MAKNGDTGYLTAYEQSQLEAIKDWKLEKPGVVTQAISTALAPFTWAADKLIPAAAIASALEVANRTAFGLSNNADLLKQGGVTRIAELKDMDLETCDRLANGVHDWAIGLAVAEGGVAGAFGVFALAADIPAILTLSLRTIHKTAMCYGYELGDEQGKQMVLGILSAANANSLEEKAGALVLLNQMGKIIATKTWKEIAARASAHAASKEGAIIMMRNLAKQVGINITKRKAAQAIPFIGAVVGASTNGWYIKDIGWAARRTFQECWLTDNGKILPADNA